MSGFQTEFPDFPADGMPPCPEGFVDESWHNDACPSYYRESDETQIFVDYPDPAMRETGGETTRFTIHRGDVPDLLSTDSWDEVLQFLKEGR